MDDAKRGAIVDYEVKDAEGNVTDTLPMLVVHVNDQDGGDGTVVGIVFDVDGTNRPVTIPADAPAESSPETPVTDEERRFDTLSDADRRQFLRDEMSRLSPEDRAAILGTSDQDVSPAPGTATSANDDPDNASGPAGGDTGTTSPAPGEAGAAPGTTADANAANTPTA